MLVCHCKAVSERQIRKAVQGGALCLDAIERTCGAGGGCGGCTPAVSEILEHELEVRDAELRTSGSSLALGALLSPT